MNPSKPDYRVSYFFSSTLVRTKKEYLENLLKGLHTVDPNGLPGNQPSMLDESTVGFIDHLSSEHLKDFEKYLRGLTTGTFANFAKHCEANNEKAELGLTVYVMDADNKTAAMFIQTNPGSRMTFGYHLDVTDGMVLDQSNITFVESGKDLVHVILSYYDELVNATKQTIN